MGRVQNKHFLLQVPAFFYGLGVRIRNFAFDLKLIKSETTPIPTICVGNLSVGGSGKTPHVELLIDLLRDEYRIAVLTRGYGRKSKEPLMASEGDTPDTIGDEPYQLLRKFPDILIYVDGDRRRALKAMAALPKTLRPDVVIMDDGFQHRYVTPTFSILLTPFDNPYNKDSLLPYGTLREPASGHVRADSVIVTKTPKDLNAFTVRTTILNLELYAYQEVYFSRIIYRNPIQLFPSNQAEILESKMIPQSPDLASDIVPLSGIADPTHFLNYLRITYPKVADPLVYPDHHTFSEKDVEQICTLLEEHPKWVLMTTEKDSVRLLKWESWFPESVRNRIWYLPIKVYLSPDNLSKLVDRCHKAIRDNTLHY